MNRAYQEHAKRTLKAVKKMKTSEYVNLAKEGHSGAKKVMSLADKPHKAKKAYMLQVRHASKPSKEDLHKAHSHMKKHGG